MSRPDNPSQPETSDVETASARYAARFDGPLGAYFLEVQRREALDLVASWPGSTVLDVGGGHGQLAVPLVEAGHDVTVAGSLPVCGERLATLLPQGRYRFEAVDLLALPYPDRSFDVVLSFRMLAHVVEWERFLGELCRVARHAVVVDYPAVASANVIGDQLFSMKKAFEGNTRRYRSFRRGELVRAFHLAGFGAPTFRPQFTLPMVAHRMLGRPALSRAVESTASKLGITQRFGSPVILRMMRMAEPR